MGQHDRDFKASAGSNLGRGAIWAESGRRTKPGIVVDPGMVGLEPDRFKGSWAWDRFAFRGGSQNALGAELYKREPRENGRKKESDEGPTTDEAGSTFRRRSDPGPSAGG